MLLHGRRNRVVRLCLMLDQKLWTRLPVRHLVTFVNEVVVDGFRDNRILFIVRVFRDEVADPSGGCHEATWKEEGHLNGTLSSPGSCN